MNFYFFIKLRPTARHLKVLPYSDTKWWQIKIHHTKEDICSIPSSYKCWIPLKNGCLAKLNNIETNTQKPRIFNQRKPTIPNFKCKFQASFQISANLLIPQNIYINHFSQLNHVTVNTVILLNGLLIKEMLQIWEMQSYK